MTLLRHRQILYRVNIFSLLNYLFQILNLSFLFQLCRSISFTKDTYENTSSRSRSQDSAQQRFSESSSSQQTSESGIEALLDLSPPDADFNNSGSSNSVRNIKQETPLIHTDSSGLGPMVGRFNFNSQTEHNNLGMYCLERIVQIKVFTNQLVYELLLNRLYGI